MQKLLAADTRGAALDEARTTIVAVTNLAQKGQLLQLTFDVPIPIQYSVRFLSGHSCLTMLGLAWNLGSGDARELIKALVAARSPSLRRLRLLLGMDELGVIQDDDVLYNLSEQLTELVRPL
jgi:hypothetical protein